MRCHFIDIFRENRRECRRVFSIFNIVFKNGCPHGAYHHFIKEGKPVFSQCSSEIQRLHRVLKQLLTEQLLQVILILVRVTATEEERQLFLQQLMFVLLQKACGRGEQLSEADRRSKNHHVIRIEARRAFFEVGKRYVGMMHPLCQAQDAIPCASVFGCIGNQYFHVCRLPSFFLPLLYHNADAFSTAFEKI